MIDARPGSGAYVCGRTCLAAWGDRGDLNPRPPGPQPGALTELSYGHQGSAILGPMPRADETNCLAGRCGGRVARRTRGPPGPKGCRAPGRSRTRNRPGRNRMLSPVELRRPGRDGTAPIGRRSGRAATEGQAGEGQRQDVPRADVPPVSARPSSVSAAPARRRRRGPTRRRRSPDGSWGVVAASVPTWSAERRRSSGRCRRCRRRPRPRRSRSRSQRRLPWPTVLRSGLGLRLGHGGLGRLRCLRLRRRGRRAGRRARPTPSAARVSAASRRSFGGGSRRRVPSKRLGAAGGGQRGGVAPAVRMERVTGIEPA